MLNFDHKAKVLKNDTHQSSLNHEGFVIVDFLDKDEVGDLLHLFESKHPESVHGFYTSTFAKDKEYRKEVDARIQSVMQRGLQMYFENYKIHCGSFIVKGADEKSALKMHQDMTLVDESIYTGINIWIPLIDLDDLNGAIEV